MLIDGGPVHGLRHQIRGVVGTEHLVELDLLVPNLLLYPEECHGKVPYPTYPAPTCDANRSRTVGPELEARLLPEVGEQGLRAQALRRPLDAARELCPATAERDALLRQAPVLQQMASP